MLRAGKPTGAVLHWEDYFRKRGQPPVTVREVEISGSGFDHFATV